MADELKELNQRHQDENVDEPYESENSVNKVEPKKITNIYYDCLERIFDFLDLESLLMVTQTCKRLQIAAAAKFGDEFGKKRVRLYPHDPEPKVITQQNEIKVYALNLCLAFLRCFGAKISVLYVAYSYTRSEEGCLDQYINQYCADTSTSIKYLHKFQFSYEAFKKPFKNIEQITIRNCDLRNQLKNFVNWFPNLHHLLLDCLFDETTPMNVSFPHLENLELHIDEYNFRIEVAANLLQANPQLQSVKLCLRSKLTLSTVLDAISTNSVITKLKVVWHFAPSISVSKEELNRFVVEHPLIVELVLMGHRLTAVDAINFIHQMKSLKRVEFEVKERAEGDRITKKLNNEWKSEFSSVGHEFYITLNS